MKYFIAALVTLCLLETLLLGGLISGYVRIGSPESMQQLAYTDSQRELMNRLVDGP